MPWVSVMSCVTWQLAHLAVKESLNVSDIAALPRKSTIRINLNVTYKVLFTQCILKKILKIKK